MEPYPSVEQFYAGELWRGKLGSESSKNVTDDYYYYYNITALCCIGINISVELYPTPVYIKQNPPWAQFPKNNL